MKYQILQIRATDAEIELFNANEDYNAVPKIKARRDMSFPRLVNSTVEALAKDAFVNGYYTHVANITAADLNHVFEIGNIGPEQNIERLDRMASVSVGDIIIDENKIVWVVADFGFEEVMELETV
jgi:hypothetical protein